MNQILCNINIGLRMQTIFILSEERKEVIETIQLPVENIPDFIINRTDIKEVRLQGNTEFINKIKDDTIEKFHTLYSDRELNFYFV